MQILAALNFCLAPIELPLTEADQLECTDSSTTRIYLVRHGESLFNIADANGVKYVSGKGLAVPLTANGIQEAVDLGKMLAEKLPLNENYVILSSTALRAQKTADLIFEQLQASHAIERGASNENFCELNQGIWEGKPKDALFDLAMKKWNSLSAKDKFITQKLEQGESPQEVAERFLAGLRTAVEENRNKTLFIVAHAAALNALAIQLNGYADLLSEEPDSSLPSISIDNCEILVLELPANSPVEKATVKMLLIQR
jgi:broad specificity phosphatase PhoE